VDSNYQTNQSSIHNQPIVSMILNGNIDGLITYRSNESNHNQNT